MIDARLRLVNAPTTAVKEQLAEEIVGGAVRRDTLIDVSAHRMKRHDRFAIPTGLVWPA